MRRWVFSFLHNTLTWIERWDAYRTCRYMIPAKLNALINDNEIISITSSYYKITKKNNDWSIRNSFRVT